MAKYSSFRAPPCRASAPGRTTELRSWAVRCWDLRLDAEGRLFLRGLPTDHSPFFRPLVPANVCKICFECLECTWSFWKLCLQNILTSGNHLGFPAILAECHSSFSFFFYVCFFFFLTLWEGDPGCFKKRAHGKEKQFKIMWKIPRISRLRCAPAVDLCFLAAI